MPRTQRLCHRVALFFVGALLILPALPASAQAPLVAQQRYGGRDLSDHRRSSRPAIDLWSAAAFSGHRRRGLLRHGDGVHGLELWKTDGIPEGTVLAVDLVPGPGSLEPSHLTMVGDRLFFAGTDAAHGRELWPIGVLVSAIFPLPLNRIPW